MSEPDDPRSIAALEAEIRARTLSSDERRELEDFRRSAARMAAELESLRRERAERLAALRSAAGSRDMNRNIWGLIKRWSEEPTTGPSGLRTQDLPDPIVMRNGETWTRTRTIQLDDGTVIAASPWRRVEPSS